MAISKPIYVSTICNLLGITKSDVSLKALNTSSKINKYALYRPGVLDEYDYKYLTPLNDYTIGHPIPSTTDIFQLVDTAPYNLGDWNKYDHYDYPFTVDFTGIASYIEADYQRSFTVTVKNNTTSTWLGLNDYNTAPLFIFLDKNNKIIKTLRGPALPKMIHIGPFTDERIGSELDKLGRDVSCTILPILVPKNSSSFSSFITSGTYKLIPPFNTKTIAKVKMFIKHDPSYYIKLRTSLPMQNNPILTSSKVTIVVGFKNGTIVSNKTMSAYDACSLQFIKIWTNPNTTSETLVVTIQVTPGSDTWHKLWSPVLKEGLTSLTLNNNVAVGNVVINDWKPVEDYIIIDYNQSK